MVRGIVDVLQPVMDWIGLDWRGSRVALALQLKQPHFSQLPFLLLARPSSQSPLSCFNVLCILSRPKINIKIKIPTTSQQSSDATATASEGSDSLDATTGNGGGDDHRRRRHYEYYNMTVQAELDKVGMIQDFILEKCGLPKDKQVLISHPSSPVAAAVDLHTSAKSKKPKNREPKIRNLSNPDKVIADYKIQDNDVIELQPIQINVTLLLSSSGSDDDTSNNPTAILTNLYPTDTIEYVKNQIEHWKGMNGSEGVEDGAGGGGGDDAYSERRNNNNIPAIPATNLSVYRSSDKKELKRDQQRLYQVSVGNNDGIDIEKTK